MVDAVEPGVPIVCRAGEDGEPNVVSSDRVGQRFQRIENDGLKIRSEVLPGRSSLYNELSWDCGLYEGVSAHV